MHVLPWLEKLDKMKCGIGTSRRLEGNINVIGTKNSHHRFIGNPSVTWEFIKRGTKK